MVGKRALHQRKISRLISNEISLDVQSPTSFSLWHVTTPVSPAEVNLGINPGTNFPSTIFPSFIFPVYIADYTDFPSRARETLVTLVSEAKGRYICTCRNQGMHSNSGTKYICFDKLNFVRYVRHRITVIFIHLVPSGRFGRLESSNRNVDNNIAMISDNNVPKRSASVEIYENDSLLFALWNRVLFA